MITAAGNCRRTVANSSFSNGPANRSMGRRESNRLLAGFSHLKFAVVLNAQIVEDVAHAGTAFGDVFRAPLHLAAADDSRQRHLAIAHADDDVARVDVMILRQRFIHFLFDARVGAAVVLRTLAAMTRHRSDRVARVVVTRSAAAEAAIARVIVVSATAAEATVARIRPAEFAA